MSRNLLRIRSEVFPSRAFDAGLAKLLLVSLPLVMILIIVSATGQNSCAQDDADGEPEAPLPLFEDLESPVNRAAADR